MMISRRPSPFGELLSLRQAMDRLFEDSFVRPRGAWGPALAEGSSLALDISTTPDALVIEAALPGTRPEDVDITVENGTLTVRGTSSSERTTGEGEYLVQEIRRGEFSRSVSLPSGLEPDGAEATFEHGVLTLRIPRAEQVKPRQIRINPVAKSELGAGSNGSTTSTDGDANRTDGDATAPRAEA
jgi:HSP20 family protein